MPADKQTGSGWFRQVLGQYPTGVCVVTAKQADGTRAGFVVGSFTSVSLDPMLVAFLADKRSTSWSKIRSAGTFCVNILGADQEHICRRFASRGDDKFQGIECREAESGSPIISGVVAWIDCEIESVQEAGDHHIVLGRVRHLDLEDPSLPLLFFQGGYGRFTPLSLAAANTLGALTNQLRDVDLIRTEMERLATDLAARCIAAAEVDGEVVVVASAGSPNAGSAATLVGQHLPFAPPNGSALAAWGEATEIDAWLAAADSDTMPADQRERLAAVRRRGYSVGLLHEAQRAFASTLDRLAVDPGAVDRDDLRALIRGLNYDPVDLSPQTKQDIRVITVPIFGSEGRPALALTVYGFPKPDLSCEIDAYIGRICLAGQRASELLGRDKPALA